MTTADSYRTFGRIIELGFCFLASLVVLVVLSFLSLRPVLVEFRSEAQAEWAGFTELLSKRNERLPGLAEALRGFESGHAKLVGKLFQARSISLHHRPPDFTVAFSDDIDICLLEVDKLSKSKPQLDKFPPFAANWMNTCRLTQQIREKRLGYNKTVAAYNGLLKSFPQNLVCAALGFLPLQSYPVTVGTITTD